jgi:two-component system nitrate/nitrite response regulator NarL
MLVGDDPAFASRLLRVLREGEPGSMSLVAATAGAGEACALAAKARPDVVLVDIEADGIQAISRLSSQSQSPVLALAAQCDDAACARAVRAGARGVVLKDDSPETIRKALRKVKEGELWLDRVTTGRIIKELVARPNGGQAANAERFAALTSREKDIVRALAKFDGASGRTLSAQLGISDQTLRNHFSAIYRKLGIPNRSGLVAFATRNHLDSAG